MLFVSLLKVIQQRPEDGASLTPATTKTGGILIHKINKGLYHEAGLGG